MDLNHPLTKGRVGIGGHQLSRDDKLHFYALTLSEMGPGLPEDDYVAFMETPYNREMTEGADDNIMTNLQKDYYWPLRPGVTGHEKYLSYRRQLDGDEELFAFLDSAHDRVLAGSNVSRLATQNSSSALGDKAKRTQTVTHVTSRGEILSRKDRMEWANIHGKGTVQKTQRWVSEMEPALLTYKPPVIEKPVEEQTEFVFEPEPVVPEPKCSPYKMVFTFFADLVRKMNGK